MSTIRVPPNVVRRTTMPSGSAAISPITVAVCPPGCGAQGRRRPVRPHRARRRRRACLRWRRTAGRCRAGRRRRRRPGSTGKVRSRPARRRRRRRGRARCRRCRRRRGSGSRSHRVCGAAASSASTRPFTGAVSDRMSASSARLPRASITAMPWSPMLPDTITLSPGRTSSGPSDRPAGIRPRPAVVTKIPSAAPRPTTLVSPVTTATPATAAAAAMSATMPRSCADREALLDDEGCRQPQPAGHPARRHR